MSFFFHNTPLQKPQIKQTALQKTHPQEHYERHDATKTPGNYIEEEDSTVIEFMALTNFSTIKMIVFSM